MTRKKLDIGILKEAYKLAFDSLDKSETYLVRDISNKIAEAYSALFKLQNPQSASRYAHASRKLVIKRNWAKENGWDSKVFNNEWVLINEVMIRRDITKYFYTGEGE